MPPKEIHKTSGVQQCGRRDIRPLQEYALDQNGTLPRGFLANALHQEGLLDYFKIQPDLNECEFSFQGTDWFGIYVKNENGQNMFYNNGNLEQGILYFKIAQQKVGREIGLKIIDVSFGVMPPELVGRVPCAVITDKDGNKKCGARPGEVTPKAPKAPAAPKATKAQGVPSGAPAPEVVNIPDEVTAAAIEALQVGLPPEQTTATSTLSRAEAEKMDMNTLVDWASKNMRSADIVTCLRSSDSLTPQELQKIDELEGDAPPTMGESGDLSAADLEAIQAAASLDPGVAKKMYKKVTKEELIQQLSSFTGAEKKNQIAELCRRSGRNVQVRQRPGRKAGTIITELVDNQGNVVADEEIDDILDECAQREADRLQNMLLSRWTSVMPMAASAYTKGNVPVYEPSQPPSPQSQSGDESGTITPEYLDQVAESAGDRREGIIQVCQMVGMPYTFTKTERPGRKPGSVIIEYKESGNNVTSDEFEDILEECKAKVASLTVSFGRRSRKKCKKAKRPLKRSKVISNFKCAVKSCKGKSNYRSCMKRTLRRMYSFGKKKVNKKQLTLFKLAAKKCKGKGKGYRKCFRTTLKKFSKNRRSPKYSAKLFKVGTVKKGRDGKRWVVRKTKTGVKRWVKK